VQRPLQGSAELEGSTACRRTGIGRRARQTEEGEGGADEPDGNGSEPSSSAPPPW
jgi:hypothetical protein